MAILKRLQQHKLVPTAVIVIALVAAPTAANVYAQTVDDPTDETVTEELVVTEDDETPTETPVVTEEPVVETPPETEEETEQTPSPSPTPTAVTMTQAQAIAELEHPESVVVASKTKTHGGEMVYKFVFADGWKVTVRASDGTVVKVQDKSDKDHDCKNKHKKSSWKKQTNGSDQSARSSENKSGDNWHRGHRKD